MMPCFISAGALFCDHTRMHSGAMILILRFSHIGLSLLLMKRESGGMAVDGPVS